MVSINEVSRQDPVTSHNEEGIYVAITHDHLDAQAIMNKVRSPSAGAIVLFAGTTRDSFQNLAVSHLAYQSYTPLALRTLNSIATSLRQKHSLTGIAIIHRLGVVPIGEESILIAVSSPHRQAAWRAGEEALEATKQRAEIWKLEEFEGENPDGGVGGGVWRSNRDGEAGVKVSDGPLKDMKEGL